MLQEFLKYFSSEDAPALIWGGFSVVISLLIAMLLRFYHGNSPQKASISGKWFGRSLPLIAPSLNIAILLVGGIAFRKVSLATQILPMIQDIALGWFTIALVYAVTQSRSKMGITAGVVVPYMGLSIFGFLDEFKKLLNELSFSFAKAEITAYQLIKVVIICVFLLWIAGALVRVIEQSLIKSRNVRTSMRLLMVTLSKTGVYIVTLMIALNILGINLTAFAVFGGAIGVGIGLGLQKISANFISGIILLVERSVEVNDLIEMNNGDVHGFVRHIGARYTLLETFDNREIMIPNEQFISQQVTNWTYTSAKGRVKISVNVSYTNNLEKVKRLLLESAREYSKCLKEPEPICFLRHFGEKSIEFTLYFWIADIREGRSGAESDVQFTIWNKFKLHGVEFYHP